MIHEAERPVHGARNFWTWRMLGFVAKWLQLMFCGRAAKTSCEVRLRFLCAEALMQLTCPGVRQGSEQQATGQKR